MKSTAVFLLLITGLCLFACMPALATADGTTTDLSTFMIPLEPAGGSSDSATVQAAASGDSYPITVKQAKDAIRTFAGSTDMDLVLSRTGTMPVGSYYLFGQTNSSSYYYVNQNSGVVEFALLAQNIPDNETFALTRDECYAQGTTFAASRYETFSQKNWKIIRDEQLNISWYRMNGTEYESLIVPTYLFTLREEKEHVLTPSTVTLLVSAVDGKVIYYGGIDRLLLVGLKPAATMSQAVEEASNHFSYQTTHSWAYLSVITRPMNYQSLAWVVTLRGTHNDHEHEETFVIDAVSGEFITDYLYGIWPDGYTYFMYYG
jgi:hypothetical protein